MKRAKKGLAPLVKREYLYEDREAGWTARIKQHGIGWVASLELYLQGTLRPIRALRVGPALTFEELVEDLQRLGSVAARAGRSLEKVTLRIPE